eukprot:g3443.t1
MSNRKQAERDALERKRRKQHGLTPELISEARECFKFHTRKGGRGLPPKRFVKILRCLGLNPTKEESSAIEKRYYGELDTPVSFNEFKSFLEEFTQKQRGAMSVLGSFKFYDRYMSEKKNTGTLTYDEMHQIFTQMGDRLDDDEWKALAKYAGMDTSSSVDIETFCDKLLRPLGQ